MTSGLPHAAAVRYGVAVRARTPASSANLGPGHHSGHSPSSHGREQSGRLRHRRRALLLMQPILRRSEQQVEAMTDGMSQQRRATSVERSVRMWNQLRQHGSRARGGQFDVRHADHCA